jgi:ATP-dependent Clp protease protease subunit
MITKLNISPKIKIKAVEDLIQLPIVIRVNNFNEDGYKQFCEDMYKAQNTGQPIIPILIDSYGGQVYSLLGMITEIQNCKLPVATICESKAMSAGAMLFGFGNQGMRFMSPHATLMIHEVSSFTYGKVQDLKVDVVETDRLNTYIFEQLSKNCGKEKNYFLDLIHHKNHADWFMTAVEAKKHNLCNQIRVPRFELDVTVNCELK